jgi:hypothetical protein
MELVQSLHFLMATASLQLPGWPRSWTRAAPVTGNVDPELRFSTLERDLLKDALGGGQTVSRRPAAPPVPKSGRRGCEPLHGLRMPPGRPCCGAGGSTTWRGPSLPSCSTPPPPNEWVAHRLRNHGPEPCAPTRSSAIGAVRIVGQRILTSQRLELLVRPG